MCRLVLPSPSSCLSSSSCFSSLCRPRSSALPVCLCFPLSLLPSAPRFGLSSSLSPRSFFALLSLLSSLPFFVFRLSSAPLLSCRLFALCFSLAPLRLSPAFRLWSFLSSCSPFLLFFPLSSLCFSFLLSARSPLASAALPPFFSSSLCFFPFLRLPRRSPLRRASFSFGSSCVSRALVVRLPCVCGFCVACSACFSWLLRSCSVCAVFSSWRVSFAWDQSDMALVSPSVAGFLASPSLLCFRQLSSRTAELAPLQSSQFLRPLVFVVAGLVLGVRVVPLRTSLFVLGSRASLLVCSCGCSLLRVVPLVVAPLFLSSLSSVILALLPSLRVPSSFLSSLPSGLARLATSCRRILLGVVLRFLSRAWVVFASVSARPASCDRLLVAVSDFVELGVRQVALRKSLGRGVWPFLSFSSVFPSFFFALPLFSSLCLVLLSSFFFLLFSLFFFSFFSLAVFSSRLRTRVSFVCLSRP